MSMRARVRKEVLEEVKEAMEVKLVVLEKLEMVWRGEKREAYWPSWTCSWSG